MINEFCEINEQIFSTLLDIYQMTYWDMTWEEFLNQFMVELVPDVEEWKKEKVDIEEDD